MRQCFSAHSCLTMRSFKKLSYAVFLCTGFKPLYIRIIVIVQKPNPDADPFLEVKQGFIHTQERKRLNQHRDH